MNAKEAREKALSVNNTRNKNQYDSIKKTINDAVEDGELSCYWYDSIRNVVQQKLENEGYKFSEYSSQKDGTTVTITW